VPAAIYTPVLIAGGGVVGLCALFLVWHGVPSLLGVPDEPMQDDGSAASPSAFGPIDQDRLEVLLRAEAHKRGADLWFSTELTWFEQDGAGVTAVLDDRAVRQQQTVRAGCLIAGDGNHSPIRQRVGIGVDGPGQLLTTITAIVEADLNPALRGRMVSIAYLQQPQPFTILMAHDDQGRRWVFTTGYDPGTPHPRTSPTTGWPTWSVRRPACPRWRSRCGPTLDLYGRGQPPGAGGRLPLRRGAHPADGVAAHGSGPGALLVRPDGLVAWRSIGRPPDPPPSSGASSAPF